MNRGDALPPLLSLLSNYLVIQSLLPLVPFFLSFLSTTTTRCSKLSCSSRRVLFSPLSDSVQPSIMLTTNSYRRRASCRPGSRPPPPRQLPRSLYHPEARGEHRHDQPRYRQITATSPEGARFIRAKPLATSTIHVCGVKDEGQQQ